VPHKACIDAPSFPPVGKDRNIVNINRNASFADRLCNYLEYPINTRSNRHDTTLQFYPFLKRNESKADKERKGWLPDFGYQLCGS